MICELNLTPGGVVDFRPGLPPDFTGPVFQGSVAISVKSNISRITLQEYKADEYQIRLGTAFFLKQVTGIGNIMSRGFHSFFMLKNSLRKQIDSIGKFHLRQGQFACIISGPASFEVKFERDIEYRTFDLFYSSGLLEELLPFFPELNDFLLSGSPSALPEITYWTRPSMKEIINQIINCPFDEASRKFYLDLKVRELLYEMLENAFRRKGKEYHFTAWETAKIHEARKILETYIATKPPTVRFLARQVALNEYKLRTGFRQYFSAGLFEWLYEQKMQHAKQLLLTTDKPVKDICSLVGYPRITNFITAFRKRFGMTPGAFRK